MADGIAGVSRPGWWLRVLAAVCVDPDDGRTVLSKNPRLLRAHDEFVTSGRLIARGHPCGVPQVFTGSGKRPSAIFLIFSRYSFSNSGVYGGNSRAFAVPVATPFGVIVAASNTVPPCICQMPLQSGSASDPAELFCCP